MYMCVYVCVFTPKNTYTNTHTHTHTHIYIYIRKRESTLLLCVHHLPLSNSLMSQKIDFYGGFVKIELASK